MDTPLPPTPDAGSPAIHPKVAWFAREMQTQLQENARKGNWETWGTLPEMLVELEYHKAKLILALRDKKPDMIREYLADCGNFLLFIGNLNGLYEPMQVETIEIDNLFSTEANTAVTDLLRRVCRQILQGADREPTLAYFRQEVAQYSLRFPEITDTDVRESMGYYLDAALTERGLPLTTLDDLRID